MTRYKRSSHTRHSTPTRHSSRIYAHTSPMRSSPRYQQRHDIKQKRSRMLRGYEDDSEDTYLSFLRATHDTEDEDCASNPDGTDIDASSDDQEWDEEATLVEMLGSPGCSETDILQALGHAFADASQGQREGIVRGLLPALRSARDARPAPGRAFITGLLGFDDACKHFEESSHRNAELEGAYANIEADLGELFEKLRTAYSRVEEKRAIFQKQAKEKTNKMREIINTLPTDVDALLAKLEEKYKYIAVDHGSSRKKKKGRERTIQGALAELQL